MALRTGTGMKGFFLSGIMKGKTCRCIAVGVAVSWMFGVKAVKPVTILLSVFINQAIVTVKMWETQKSC